MCHYTTVLPFNDGLVTRYHLVCYITFTYLQGRNHVFKVGGLISWFRVLLPFYRKNRQVYPVWCSWLHNHTLFIKNIRKQVWGPSKFWGVRTPRLSSGCAHVYLIIYISTQIETVFYCSIYFILLHMKPELNCRERYGR